MLGPRRALVNPERINDDNMPDVLRGWELLWAPEMVDTGISPPWPYARASLWSGMNFFMINPGLAVVNEAQRPLIKLLEKNKIDVVPMTLRHCITMSGCFHCVTLDVRRQGTLEDYS